MATLAELIDRYRITIDVKEGAPPSDTFPGATGYTVTLRRDGIGDPNPDQDIAPVWASRDGMTVPFYCGPGHTKEPTAENVLYCLLSDASGYDNARDFEEWASEYGYDPDSRKAEAIYNEIAEQRQDLYEFLSDSDYQAGSQFSGYYHLNRGEHYDEFLEAEQD